jgi:hypothetical protein
LFGRPKKRKRFKARKPDKKLCSVYGLVDETGVRYIGQTKIELARRFKFHMKDAVAKPDRNLSAWLLEAPRKIILLDGNATWDVSEIIAIDRARQSGARLFNQLRGGNDTIHAVRRENKGGGRAMPKGFNQPDNG